MMNWWGEGVGKQVLMDRRRCEKERVEGNATLGLIWTALGLSCLADRPGSSRIHEEIWSR